MPYRVFVNNLLYGDRIIVPEAFLPLHDDLIDSYYSFLVIPNSKENKENAIPCGVLEYTAHSNEIYVSQEVYDSLKLTDEDFVELEPISLPKATSITLKTTKPIHSSINLEQVLINRITEKYTCVYINQTIYFMWENESIQCEIIELSPAKYCSLINTDIEVHLETVQLQEETTSECYSLTQENPTIDLQSLSSHEFTVTIDNAVSQQIQIKGPDLCCIVYLNYTPDEEFYNEKQPVSSFYHKQSYFVDTERIISIPSSIKLWIEIISGQSIHFSIDSTSFKSSQSLSSSSQEGIECSNCHRFIPSSSYQLHQAYCQRNIIPCSICHKPIQKQYLSQHQHCSECGFATTQAHLPYHIYYQHTPKPCLCGEMICPVDQANHYLSCSQRRTVCRFCHENHLFYQPVPGFQQDPVDRFEGLSIHESICANKTVECSICHSYIMLRYLIQHTHLDHHQPQILNHYIICSFCGFRQNLLVSSCLKCHSPINLQSLLSFSHCSNLACSNHLSEDSFNSEGLCSSCYKAFFPYKQDTRKNILTICKYYLLQYSHGCGQTSCSNPLCKCFSGRTCFDLPAFLKSFQITGTNEKEIAGEMYKLTKLSITNHVFCICPTVVHQ